MDSTFWVFGNVESTLFVFEHVESTISGLKLWNYTFSSSENVESTFSVFENVESTSSPFENAESTFSGLLDVEFHMFRFRSVWGPLALFRKEGTGVVVSGSRRGPVRVRAPRGISRQSWFVGLPRRSWEALHWCPPQVLSDYYPAVSKGSPVEQEGFQQAWVQQARAFLGAKSRQRLCKASRPSKRYLPKLEHMKAVDHALQAVATIGLSKFMAAKAPRPLRCGEERYFVAAEALPPKIAKDLEILSRACVRDESGLKRLELCWSEPRHL